MSGVAILLSSIPLGPMCGQVRAFSDRHILNYIVLASLINAKIIASNHRPSVRISFISGLDVASNDKIVGSIDFPWSTH